MTQAKDERLVGGGDVTVLPEGIDIEVMKTGGLGGLYFSIANARFLYLQLLASPRMAGVVRAVAPQSEGKLLYLTTADGEERTVRASGDIPSANAAVGAAPELAAGSWRDDSADRRWTRPTRAELESDIDHFHVPPKALADRPSWAEWHYFNIVSADRRRWAFITLMLAGEVPDGRWGGQVLVTTHETPAGGGPTRERRFTATVPPAGITYSTTSPDLTVGVSHVTLLGDGRYEIVATAQEQSGRGGQVKVNLVVDPVPGAYFPGTAIETGDFASGYTVPGLEANGTGTLCIECGVRAFQWRAGVSRPQLGRVEGRDVGVGIGAGGELRVVVRACAAAGFAGSIGAAVRVSGGQSGISRGVPAQGDRLR